MRSIPFLFLLLLSICITAQDPPEFGELIHATDLGSQTPTPDRSIVGVQVAEGHLWVTGFDPDDYWQHKLYKYNLGGTELIEVYDYGIEAAGWKDMAYDGEHLYVTDMDTIRELDPATGEKTGGVIPAPFYYNSGLAYNPLNDHFYVTGDGGNNIYEIDREGNIIGAIADYANRYTTGLAVDTVSPGGPFLWTHSNEEVGYSLEKRISQISLLTNQFTGIEFDGESISSIIVENAGGATIAYDYAADSITFIGINIRNGNANDQMEYAMYYNITRDDIPGPQIAVTPSNIQNVLVPGDSLDINVEISNSGDGPLFWSAYIETPDQDTIDDLGDLLFSFNATLQTPGTDRGLNAVTFLNDVIYINGRNFPNQQEAIYKFDKEGNFLGSHPYNSISPAGFTSLTTDGVYLYADDTYAILQIDPGNFSVAGYLFKPSGTYRGFTYDPQTDHFWLGNGNGLIYEINRDGEEVNEYLTPYDLQGLAWDRWSPGGPFLWAWVETNNEEGSQCEAVRLDPHTCTPVGEGFTGFSFSNDPMYQDIPNGAVITNQWEENRVSLIGLQNASFIEEGDTIEDHDFLAVYDLDVVPPPEWIEIVNTSYGTTQPDSLGQFTVRLRSIMDDTLMTAVVRIANNDIQQPEVVIPVNFEMSALFTDLEEIPGKREFVLGQNYPNPASGTTFIPVSVENEGPVELTIYDLNGQSIATYEEYVGISGEYVFRMDVSKIPHGVYIYRLITPDGSWSKQMIIKN